MATIKSEWIIDTGAAESNVNSLINSVERYKGNIGTIGDLNRSTFKESSAAVVDFNKQLANGTKIFQTVENSAKGFDNELKRLRTVYQDLQKGQKQFIAEGRYEELQQNIAGVKQRMKELGDETENVEKKQGRFKGMLQNGLGLMSGFFAIDAIIGAGKAMFATTAEFEKYDAVLTNMYGSSALAQESLQMIKDVAKTTPVSVSELTDSFIKLAGRGVDASSESLKGMADVAAYLKKDLGQLTEGILDVNNTERWNELGIKVSTNGNKISGTLRGVTVEVEKSEAGAAKMIAEFAKIEGVAGSTDAVAKTIGGAWNNFGDVVDEVSVTIGGALKSVAMGALGMASTFLAGVVTVVNILKAVPSFVSENRVAFYALGVALISLNAANIVAAGSFLLWVGRMKIQAIWTDTVALKTRIMNATMKANPIGLVIAAISLLVGGMVIWYNQSEKVRAITQRLFSAIKELGSIAVDVFKAIVMPTPANLMQAADSLKNFGSKVSAAYDEGYNAQVAKDKKANDAKAKAEADKKAQLEIDRAKYQAKQKAIAEAAAQKLANEERKKKQEEADKKEAAARKKALADLAKQLESLEKEAGKARLDAMDKNSQAYIDAVMKQRLKEIQAVEDELIATSKAAGKGGQLAAPQKEQLSVLRNAAYDERNKALLEIEQANAEKLFSLQKESDAKQLQSIENKYAKEIDAAKKSKNEVLVQALEKAKGLELAEAKLAQANKKLDNQESIAIGTVEVGAFEYDSTDSATEIEKKKQQAILDIQLEFARKRLALLAGENDEESMIRKLNLQKTINDLQKQSDDLGKKKPFNMMDLLGVKEEDREQVKEALSEVVSFVQEFTAARLESANELVEQRKNDVESAEDDLNTEIELNKLGFASNVEAKRAELEEKRKLQQQALEDQKKAQRAQMAIETITQTVGLITSSVDIIKGFSKIPIIGLPLGIAAVAAMFGAFVSMKAKAMQSTKMAKGGLLGGRLHSEGGNKFVSLDGSEELEHEKGEFFVNRKSTAKRLDWLEAINADDEKRLADLAFQHLLEGTGVAPAKSTAKKAAVASSAYQAAKDTAAGKVNLKAVETELKAIKKNTSKDGLVYEDDSKKVVKFGNVTRTIRKK